MDATTTYGIEIEAIFPAGMDMHTAALRLNADSGVDIRGEHYNHSRRRHWKIVTDGSLNGNGLELVSPPLSGEAGLIETRAVCDALNRLGASINRSCGLHVHLGIADDTPATIKNLIRIYAHYEAEIDRLMPGSRRGNGNTYCRSIAPHAQAVADAPHLYGITAALNGRSDRYKKVNLLSYERHQTIEFRQHSGTTDPDKICNWVKLLVAMLAAARKGKFPQGAKPAIIAKAGSKAAGVGALILRDGGATSEEINAFVGRPGVNVITIAAACGITIRKERQGRITRYFAIGGGPTEASFESLTAMIELPADITAFYAKRREDLARMSPEAQEIEQNRAVARPATDDDVVF